MIKIGLDAGHGLNTSGKQTPDGIKEWSLNDKVRDKVVAILKEYDVEIIHTDNDEGNTDESLASRINMYLNAGVNAFVSIHHNAYTGSWNGATGVEVYTDKNPTSADLHLADCIYGRLVNNTKLRGRGIKKENWYVINQNKIPAVLVEGGFMDGTNDYKYITSDEGQTAYARAVADGLIEFLGLTKKATTPTPTPTKSLDDWAKEVIAGKHGTGHANREASLKKAGCPFAYSEVRARVNALCGVKTTTTPSIYYPKYTGSSNGIDTVLRAVGVPETFLGNWKNRRTLADKQGIKNYTGTAKQNLELIALAKNGKLKRV